MNDKTYPGKLVLNCNVGKRMHLIAQYKTFFGRKEGIYSDAFDVLVKTIVKRRRDGLMTTLMIEGDPGSGKSSMGLNLCVAIARALGCGFDLAKDLLYSPNDLWKKLEDPEANPINFMDEGSVILASNNAMQKSDRNIAVLFDTMRSRNYPVNILCSPTHLRINSSIRKDHIDFKIRCTPKDKPLIKGYGRGFFECRRAVRHEFKRDEPEWYMMYAGIFGDYPPMIREEYLNIKYLRQSTLMSDMIERARLDEAKKTKEKEKLEKSIINGQW